MTDPRQAAQQAPEPLPCPFCGHVGVTHHEGSTFRWMVTECDRCGAQCGEERINTMTMERSAAMEQAKEAAIKTWNTRAAQPQQQAEPVLSRWIGCGECDCTFKCYGSGKECIRLPVEQQAEPPPEWESIKNILDEYGLDAITFVAEWKAAQRPWVGLTEQDMPSGEDPMFDHQYFLAGMVYAAKVLQERNNG